MSPAQNECELIVSRWIACVYWNKYIPVLTSRASDSYNLTVHPYAGIVLRQLHKPIKERPNIVPEYRSTYMRTGESKSAVVYGYVVVLRTLHAR